MPKDWSCEEVEAAVTDYLDMLLMEIRGEEFNKAERNRRLQKFLHHRSRASVEWKHRNISAVLLKELGLPYVRGYRPAYNYQRSLLKVVEERVAGAAELLEAIARFVSQPAGAPRKMPDILSVVVPPPERDKDEPLQLRSTPSGRRAIPRNFLETESQNRSLGLAGEEFVFLYEQKRLWHAGQKRLVDQIEHVAKTQGDGFGYDIRSFEENGSERLIEVKTTRFGQFTPFFATPNEVDVSQERQTHYRLYRLFNFRTEPRMFILAGALTSTCTLEPFQFIARPYPAAYPRRRNR